MRSTAAVAIVPEAAVPDAAPADEEAAAPKAELLVVALDAMPSLHPQGTRPVQWCNTHTTLAS